MKQKRLSGLAVGRLSAFFFLICLSAYLLNRSPSWAAFSSRDRGTSGAQFLKIPAGARAAAMGGAFSSVANDATAAYWNPAGLGQISKRELVASHNNFPSFYRYSYLSFAQPLSYSRFTFGFSFTSLEHQAIQKIDNTETAFGRFAPSDQSYCISLTRPIGDGSWALGASEKWIFQGIDGETAKAIAFDVGLLRRVKAFAFSLTADNIGQRVQLRQASAPLPLTFKTGLSYRLAPEADQAGLPAGIASLDLVVARDNDPAWHAGLERWAEIGPFRQIPLYMAFRAGFRTETARPGEYFDGLTAGIGLQWGSLSLDLAVQPSSQLGHSYQLGIRVKI
ncbi:MAG: PorV/PorQ family protein [Elusimicrobiota bacterium]